MSSNANPIRPGMWRVPAWLATVIVVVCLSGGIASVWWWLQRDTHDLDSIAIDASLIAGRRSPGSPQEMVVRGKDSTLQARAGGLFLRYTAADGDLKVHPAQGGQALTPEEEKLRRMVRQMMDNPTLAKKVQLTDAQRNKLNQLNLKPGSSLPDADCVRLATLAKACQQVPAGDAKAAAADKALLDAMKAIAARNAASTQPVALSVKRIETILTPGQIRLCQELQGKPTTRPLARATTRPTARPTVRPMVRPTTRPTRTARGGAA
ncbi:MAG TPA: hypothetical protein VHP11_01810 [Tepidisphaeraceae bacterium]|nr:hypothetical protein [Tepidisphaeraceae bacterium]